MQYYESPKDAEISQLISSVKKIINAVDAIDDLRVLGGEPFMFKDLPDFLCLLKESQKVGRITIYTNATFVPKDNVLAALKNEKIEVEITDYDELSRAHSKLIDAFAKAGVRYITHKPQNWTDSARIVKNQKSDDDLSEMFNRCCVNDVLSLLHGKLYHCPFSANAHNLGTIESDITDWVDLQYFSSDLELREAILKFYFGKSYQTACKHCLGRDFTQPQVVPAIQIRKAIPIPIVSQKWNI
jgi:hypothetical protein